MSFINCFDAVSTVVEEANEKFKPLWEINQEKYEGLKEDCSVIDLLAGEFEADSIEASIDEEETKYITITFECPEITIESKEHRFFELTEHCLAFAFSPSDEGNLLIKFLFPSVWEKADKKEV